MPQVARVLLLLFCVVGASAFNSTFTPWTVMGPVMTNATGFAVLEPAGEMIDYEIHLFDTVGIVSVELHVGEPGTHGDVVVVFFASAFPTSTSVTNGLAAKGSLMDHNLLGPLLLPLGNHLPVSELVDRYLNLGKATVVVHTMANPGGELGAGIQAVSSPPAEAPGTSMVMPMDMSTTGTTSSPSAPMAMPMAMQSTAPKSSLGRK